MGFAANQTAIVLSVVTDSTQAAIAVAVTGSVAAQSELKQVSGGAQMGFWERSRQLLHKGMMSSKEIVENAAAKSKELGEKGVARVTIKQLERQVENRFAQLGRHVYQVLIKEGQQTISRGTDEIKGLLGEVQDLESDIDQRESQL